MHAAMMSANMSHKGVHVPPMIPGVPKAMRPQNCFDAVICSTEVASKAETTMALPLIAIQAPLIMIKMHPISGRMSVGLTLLLSISLQPLFLGCIWRPIFKAL
jgi:hypothetical protein